MIYFATSLIILILLIFPLKIRIFANLKYYQINLYFIKLYNKEYLQIKDIQKERNVLNILKIFKLIDIKIVNIKVGGIKDYYLRSLSYSLMYISFNLLGLIINDQFHFNYSLDYDDEPKVFFECIIMSNLGKIILTLIKGAIKNERTSDK